MQSQKQQLKKIVPEFGEDPFKELDDVWQDTFGEEQTKKVDKNAGSLLLQQMHKQRREMIVQKLEKRK